MQVESIDPGDAEAIVEGFERAHVWSARRVNFKANDGPVIVIIYSDGPSAHHHAVEKLLDAGPSSEADRIAKLERENAELQSSLLETTRAVARLRKWAKGVNDAMQFPTEEP